MIIAIPSKGRPTGVKSTQLLPGATLYVPRSEADDYRRAGHANVVEVPDTVRGITKTRNYILETASDERVVFVDDDAKNVGWVELKASNCKHQKLTTTELESEFTKLFDLTEQLGYRLWGVATQSAPRSVYPWKPFLWHTYVTASCMGVLRSKCRFDESFPVKEDYELCLRAIKEDGGIVGARYLYWENEHWTTEGGCKQYRTGEMEADCTKRLMKLYPGLIRRVQRCGTNYSIELDF